ncbi:hypothetical protein GLE_4869 [Lysobacter enzymogenes]|uniref:Uncharacterized protein n=1 Tax=Lysobacter enzymogenes TaxID=69 RepID=A0A0S2DNP0_LYSEN|nr:hypothetical protein GLE_4869 [Lysobacter enzymogenes]
MISLNALNQLGSMQVAPSRANETAAPTNYAEVAMGRDRT